MISTIDLRILKLFSRHTKSGLCMELLSSFPTSLSLCFIMLAQNSSTYIKVRYHDNSIDSADIFVAIFTIFFATWGIG